MKSKSIQKKVLAAVAVLLSLLVVRYNAHQKSNFILQKKTPLIETTAYAKRVVDGDTIELSSGERVRYIGINTPEVAHHHKSAEYYGKEAKEFNKKLVLGKNIRLEFDEEGQDKYGRTLAYVYLEDGTFVNAELVRQGCARTMTIKPNIKYAGLFNRLQEEAKMKNLGLWKK